MSIIGELSINAINRSTINANVLTLLRNEIPSTRSLGVSVIRSDTPSAQSLGVSPLHSNIPSAGHWAYPHHVTIHSSLDNWAWLHYVTTHPRLGRWVYPMSPLAVLLCELKRAGWYTGAKSLPFAYSLSCSTPSAFSGCQQTTKNRFCSALRANIRTPPLCVNRELLNYLLRQNNITTFRTPCEFKIWLNIKWCNGIISPHTVKVLPRGRDTTFTLIVEQSLAFMQNSL